MRVGCFAVVLGHASHMTHSSGKMSRDCHDEYLVGVTQVAVGICGLGMSIRWMHMYAS